MIIFNIYTIFMPYFCIEWIRYPILSHTFFYTILKSTSPVLFFFFYVSGNTKKQFWKSGKKAILDVISTGRLALVNYLNNQDEPPDKS
ncbi:hypothetical protein M2451_002867 [Dysgonomonas sp. PFB1-18]|nr:hypothetical protein [Dysgonomonas sp. PF1-14]MDH6339886.1 hypothetical protein [Dysgonomonas sp. PF1-16]MDH6381534.1 hypothetical protein [Dysgonomonas sp. PFB1-18]MDH6398829.1 hypothetical protein [Dysgonomonas sp. PF1-23]